MAAATLEGSPVYALGHSADELNRLIEQGRFFGDLTAQVLREAGLGAGMRVLDVGCGAGDVSFLAAGLVGPTGTVTGVDRSPEAIDLATRRAAAAGLTNVRFRTGDLTELVPDEPIDAVVGRLVLMYLTDPAVALRRLTAFLPPGGIVAFHEFDIDGATSEPPCPLFQVTVRRIEQTLGRAGADVRTGLKLGRIFREAGLPAPRMILGARVERGPDSLLYDQVTQVTRTLLPLMERTGVATAEEVDVETLADRLREEAVALDATLVSPSFVGAWARTGVGSVASR
jgi:ubiquinone/menaquinone biosynthesis C-methylase UbiE